MRRIVVIGDGMVGSRFTADVVAADPDIHVTVLGQEKHAAYNRVLLSSVVAGSKDADLLTIAEPPHPRVRVLTGVGAASIDTELGMVIDDHGHAHPYAELVIAAGSQARVPPIQGVADPDGLVDGVFVLKDLADAQGIVAHASRARRAVVLGAGVLGIEVATGLARRGLSVRIVHVADRLMDRQLGFEASTIAQSSLRRLGIEPHVGASIAGVTTHRGKVSGVRLEDGSELATDMLVMCCGTIPETLIARKAGLAVDRGIVVDERMATSRERVWAIGDCAQPPEGASGLVAQGWDQAQRLVRVLTGAPSAVTPAPSTSDVVRVKAPGMALVAMGVCGDFDRSDPRYRVVSLKDPDGGRYLEVVVSDGTLVGATCIGDAQVAANLSAMYTRGMQVPGDPALLLVRALAGAAAPPTLPQDLGDDDKVCNCNTVTAGTIRAAIDDGCESVGDIALATRATTGCGDCTGTVSGLLECAREGTPVAG